MKRLLVNVLSIVLVVAMVMSPAHTYESKAFTEEEAEWIAEAKAVLYDILEEKDVTAVVYLTEQYPVREGASVDSAVVINVPSGQTVTIQDVELTEEYEAWAKVSIIYRNRFFCRN